MESSVLFSLAELQRMEQDRVDGEEQQRVMARERRERERRDAEAIRHRLEQERLVSERAAAEEHARRFAAAEALDRARVQAALDVARIETEAKLRLAAAEQTRTHELELLRSRTNTRLYRACIGLSVALALALSLGALGAWKVDLELNRLKHDALQSSKERNAIATERDDLLRDHRHSQQGADERLQALEKNLTACEARSQTQTGQTPPIRGPKRPPAEQSPPPRPCKEGDPLCDTNRPPR
jgi:hypothetical protein